MGDEIVSYFPDCPTHKNYFIISMNKGASQGSEKDPSKDSPEFVAMPNVPLQTSIE